MWSLKYRATPLIWSRKGIKHCDKIDMKWLDVTDIVLELIEKHPEVDPRNIRFTDLHRWVCELDDFDDVPDRCNERILEAIQTQWLEEKE